MAPIKCPKQYCGEVFITNNFLMMLECKFCTEEFVPYGDFLNHIFDKHIDDIEVYQSDTEEDNDDEIDIFNSQEIDNDTPGTNSLELTEFIKTEQSIEISACNTLYEEESVSVQPYKNQKDIQQRKRRKIEISTKPHNKPQSETQHQTKLAAAYTNVRAVLKKVPAIKKKEIEGKYKCRFCGDAFISLRSWQTHELRHTDNKSFCCTECDKKFFTKTELVLHVRWHTGERPFVCSFCGASFVTSSSLRPHERAHRNERKYKCDQCDKSYFTGALLKKHRTVHTGERNYKCKVCSNTFTRSSSLRNHIKLHENALRYECNLCSKRFNQKPALIWHKKRSHNIISDGGTVIGETPLLQEANKTPSRNVNEIICEQRESEQMLELLEI